MREIVGIAGNARQFLLSLTPEPIYYMPFRQLPWGCVDHRAFRPAAGDAGARTSEGRLGSRPVVAVHGVTTFDEALESGVAPPRLLVLLMGSFAAIALLLTATGLYGLLAYGVQQRTREFGVRMALGAQRPTIVGVVTREALVLVAGMGVALGGLGVVARLRRHPQSRARDRPTAADSARSSPCGVILLTAISSATVPARRAAGVDPTEALRAE